MSKSIVSLVVYTQDGDQWDVTFHTSEKAANKHAATFTSYDAAWIVQKLEDITASELPMTIEHLNSFIERFISPEKATEDLSDAQNLVWGYLATGGQSTEGNVETAGNAAPDEDAAATPQTAGQGEDMAQTATETRRRPAKRKEAAKKTTAAPKAAKPKTAKSAAKPKTAKKASNGTSAPRADSKVNSVLTMMRREKGATVAEIAEALEWETKSVHGVISGIIRKKMGLKPKTEKHDKRGNVYHLPA